ncbi:MAG: MFS transporter [Leptospirales bacterium]
MTDPFLPALPSRISLFGLNAMNFFLGEIIGVGIPFLNDFLKTHHWSFQDVGIATSMVGIGTLLFQGFSGVIADLMKTHRLLMGGMILIYGICFSLLPATMNEHSLSDGLLLTVGMASSFFIPLSATLAFSLVGHRSFARVMGQNQMWNHAGFLASALTTLAVVRYFGLGSVFLSIAMGSCLGILSLFLIRKNELIYHLRKEEEGEEAIRQGLDSIRDDRTLLRVFLDFFRNPTIRILLISTTLFQISNAPVMPLLLLYLRFLEGGNGKLAWVVLIAQAAMIPVAWWSARYSPKWGHKLVFSIAFIVMPIRSVLCAITTNTDLLLATQVLDGVAAGIYGVVVPLIVSDLTRGKKGFNMLMGLSQIAMAVGAIIGPMIQGVSVGEVGFRFAFLVFAGVASLGAILFFHFMPEVLSDKQ